MFYNVTIKPEIPANLQDGAVFDGDPNHDVVFDWTEFKMAGTSRLIGITMTQRDYKVTKPADFAGELWIASTNEKTMGAINSAQAMLINPDLVFTVPFSAGYWDATLSEMSIGRHEAIREIDPGPVLAPGSDRTMYIGMITTTNNLPDLQSALTIDGAVAAGASSTITLADVDARQVLAKGDVLHAQDNAVIGTVASVDSATQVTLTSLNVDALADDDEVYVLSPITITLHFEK